MYKYAQWMEKTSCKRHTHTHICIHIYGEREGGKEREGDWRGGEEMKGGEQGEGRRERGTGGRRRGIGYLSVKTKTYIIYGYIYM